jgi:chromosomal replication initiator protein
LNLATSVVKNIARKSKQITIEVIKKLVCKQYRITLKEIVSTSRKQAIVRPRQVAIYLARRYTDSPLQSIGKSFKRYHATALHSIAAVERELKQNGSLKQQVDYLCKKLENGRY